MHCFLGWMLEHVNAVARIQLGVWESAVKSHSGVRSEAPAANALTHLRLSKCIWWQHLS